MDSADLHDDTVMELFQALASSDFPMLRLVQLGGTFTVAILPSLGRALSRNVLRVWMRGSRDITAAMVRTLVASLNREVTLIVHALD